MLPDLPALKRDIQCLLDRYLQQATNSRMGVFADVPRHRVHEGREMRIHRADGSVEDTAMKQASAEMVIKFEEVPHLSLQDRIKKLDVLAETMAQQMAEHLFGSLGESLEKAGQVVDGGGKPFSAETLFAVLEKLQVDFDKEGQPKNLQLVVGSALVPKLQEIAEQERLDPSLRSRHEEIMSKKWVEWRDREASRTLVG